MGLNAAIAVTKVYEGIKSQFERVKKQNARTYRDENGTLISKCVHTWEEIKEQIESKNLSLGRDVPTAKRYHEKMVEIAKEWQSISDYCKYTYLKYPIVTKQNSAGNVIKYVTDIVDNDTALPGLQMDINDFPYYISEGIRHFVLWSSKERDWYTYENYVTKQFPDDEILMFENSVENKSVKSVVHIHVFVRSRETL